jgi:hypothetical protein
MFPWTCKITPFALSDRDRYSRLFPPTDTEIAPADSRLECLAWSMCDKQFAQDTFDPMTAVPAGYTYFGQFIDHDMTSEDLSANTGEVWNEPSSAPNLRVNWLNLDCLYGNGPKATKIKIYEDDGVSFRVGGQTEGNQTFDVPLDPISHKPLAADPRNLENAIVRQVHALFLKLHNLAAKNLPASLAPADRFTQARRSVRHQFQWLVRNDFLKRFCDPRTYRAVLKNPIFDWQGRFSIPVEFSRAAFRFGHSTVRDQYELATVGTAIPLCKLFGGENSLDPLPKEHAIPWFNFLGLGTTSRETSLNIDTSIVRPLFHVPSEAARLFRVRVAEENTLALPHVTLKRGAASRLPSGEAVRRVLRAEAISAGAPAGNPWMELVSCGLRRDVPLWYYILLEAQQNQKGVRLGPVGSRIVAEVIEAALWANQDSYLRVYGRNWKPADWKTEHGDLKPIRCLFDVASVVGLTPPS